MSQFFQLLIYGLQLGTIYALVALGDDFCAVQHFGNSLFVLDRYFLTCPC